eukprot:GHVU01118574.1.p1 GENE.GHVU01118574.1~~GHVU01118574.1.p1  ORF type:complete len:224 (-),score=32.42 GHVU01118574.1:1105-1776(-)
MRGCVNSQFENGHVTVGEGARQAETKFGENRVEPQENNDGPFEENAKFAASQRSQLTRTLQPRGYTGERAHMKPSPLSKKQGLMLSEGGMCLSDEKGKEMNCDRITKKISPESKQTYNISDPPPEVKPPSEDIALKPQYKTTYRVGATPMTPDELKATHKYREAAALSNMQTVSIAHDEAPVVELAPRTLKSLENRPPSPFATNDDPVRPSPPPPVKEGGLTL